MEVDLEEEGREPILRRWRVTYTRHPSSAALMGYNPKEKTAVHDSDRIGYHKSYLAALAKSMRKGANVKGYFAWSFMDNFEWLQGYDATYGLYYVNRTTLERIPRLSARWYTGFLANKSPQNGDKFTTLDPFLLSKVVKDTSSRENTASMSSV